MRGRPVADGVAWPIPSFSGAHAHYAYNSTMPYTYTVVSPMEQEVHYTRTFLFAAEFLLRASAVTGLSS